MEQAECLSLENERLEGKVPALNPLEEDWPTETFNLWEVLKEKCADAMEIQPGSSEKPS